LPRAAFSRPRSQFFTIQTDPKPVNNLFIFFQALKRKKTHASVTVTVIRDRKIRTALRTNHIVGFVTVPAWKKKYNWISLLYRWISLLSFYRNLEIWGAMIDSLINILFVCHAKRLLVDPKHEMRGYKLKSRRKKYTRTH